MNPSSVTFSRQKPRKPVGFRVLCKWESPRLAVFAFALKFYASGHFFLDLGER